MKHTALDRRYNVQLSLFNAIFSFNIAHSVCIISVDKAVDVMDFIIGNTYVEYWKIASLSSDIPVAFARGENNSL